MISLKSYVMKQIKILIELVDIFFKLFILGLVIAAGLMIADAFSRESSFNYNFDTQNYFFWIFLVVELFEWILFLRGVYFLRAVARILLLNETFSELIIRFAI